MTRQKMHFWLEISPVNGKIEGFRIISDTEKLLDSIEPLVFSGNVKDRVGKCNCCCREIEIVLYEKRAVKSLEATRRVKSRMDKSKLDRFKGSTEPELPVGSIEGVCDENSSLGDVSASVPQSLKRKKSFPASTERPHCNYCNKIFSLAYLARRHERMVHERKIILTCELCGFGTHSSSAFKAHNLKFHTTNPKPFLCDLCHLSCSTKVGIAHHMKLFHLTSTGFICEICSKQLANQSGLETHKLSHTNVKEFVCFSCTKAFKCKSSLKLHHKTVHLAAELKARFSCGTCEYTTHDKKSFGRHRYRHLEESAKPFQCQQCGRGFVTSTYLRSHEKTHL